MRKYQMKLDANELEFLDKYHALRPYNKISKELCASCGGGGCGGCGGCAGA